jgi:hypothetical protein
LPFREYFNVVGCGYFMNFESAIKKPALDVVVRGVSKVQVKWIPLTLESICKLIAKSCRDYVKENDLREWFESAPVKSFDIDVENSAY